jgi:dihydroorotate dehydrogenase
LSPYRHLALPLLARTDPERIHERTLALVAQLQRFSLGRLVLCAAAGACPPRPVTVAGVRFPNPLGVAAGFDKDARVALGLACLGFGHVEVGTLTPRPQAGNPRPRLFRLREDEALINRLGFPNHGVDDAVPRLERLFRRARRPVLGVSLGKQKETPLEEAAEDYGAVLEAVYRWADYLVVNVSSPNTPGLRRLQGRGFLAGLLSSLTGRGAARAAALGVAVRPLLVKVAPDLAPGELEAVLDDALGAGVAGVVATNTTVDREGLRSPLRGEAGGLSGRPLEERSTWVVGEIARLTGGRLPVIGVGGVADPAGARAKLDAGAVLIQVYTGLVYQGPGLAGRLLRDLARRPAGG